MARGAASIGACLLLVAACNRGKDSRAGWHYVTTGSNGEKFYVDTTTLRRSGDERTFSLIAVEAKPKLSFGASYDRTETDDRVTCAGRTFVLGNLRGYSGDSVVFDNPGENPVPIRPGGPFEAIHLYVCSK
jgi:hypothetical protein